MKSDFVFFAHSYMDFFVNLLTSNALKTLCVSDAKILFLQSGSEEINFL